jgi:hypothetical protein
VSFYCSTHHEADVDHHQFEFIQTGFDFPVGGWLTQAVEKSTCA